MRYVLIDYMHLAHKCIVAQPLSATAVINGEVVPVDTTIPNYTIKNIYSYGGKGLFHTGVCLEGGNSFRKRYFSSGGSADGSGYKGSRSGQRGSFYEGINLTVQLLLNGKVSLYRCADYEADDMLYSLVKKIKEVDKVTPIDVITNDSDLLPLVDDQVSVYIRGTREFSEDGCPVRRLYYQVTPRSWEEYLSYSSAYKGYKIPYNSILLFKLLKGDKADNIAGACDGYGGKKYSEVMTAMENSVVIDEKMKAILKRYFAAKKISLIDVVSIKEAALERYTQKDKEKFAELLDEKLAGTINKRSETSLQKKIEKDNLQDVLNFEKMDKIKEDMDKWLNMQSLIDMKVMGVDLKEELMRVLQVYFTIEEINQMILEGLDLNNMFTYGIDFPNVFRYGVDFDKVIRPVLKPWFTEEEINKMKFTYGGICLRRVDVAMPKQIEKGLLQAALTGLRINLPK